MHASSSMRPGPRKGGADPGTSIAHLAAQLATRAFNHGGHDMKSRIMMMALVCGLALTACSKSNEEKKATQQGGQTGPEWSLSLESKCLDGSKETCVAYYGFAVDAA